MYINSIGKTGLKPLPTPPFFEVLHHLPFNDDDIKTLQNPCSKHYFSFTPQGMQQYISTIGTTGMPMLKTFPLFRVLNNASTPLAQ